MSPPSKLAPSHHLSFAILIQATACITTPPSHQVDAMPSARGALVQVTNRSVDDLQVFLVRSGTAVRVGSVSALTTRVVLISAAQLGGGGELELLAKPRRSSWVQRSPAFTASAGQILAWAINERLSSQVVVVR